MLEQLDAKFDDMSSQIVDRSALPISLLELFFIADYHQRGRTGEFGAEHTAIASPLSIDPPIEAQMKWAQAGQQSARRACFMPFLAFPRTSFVTLSPVSIPLPPTRLLI